MKYYWLQHFATAVLIGFCLLAEPARTFESSHLPYGDTHPS